MKKYLLILALSAFSANAFAADSGMAVGTGTAKFNGLFQAWAVNDNTSSSAVHHNYKVRRAEMKFSGSVMEDSRWFVMADPSKALSTPVVAGNDNSILQDIGLAHTFFMPELEFTIGQFKAPNVAESMDSSAELPLTERSIVARSFGEKRTPGAMLTYKTMMYKAAVMFSNGQKNNNMDTNNRKDIDARLDLTPTDDLKLGAFTTLGDYAYSVKGVWGVNAHYSMNNWGVSLEGVKQHVRAANTYALNGTLTYTYMTNWMGAFRYQDYRVSRGGIHAFAYDLGVSYMFMKSNSKVTAQYSRLHNMLGGAGTPTVLDYTKGNQIVVAFQQSI